MKKKLVWGPPWVCCRTLKNPKNEQNPYIQGVWIVWDLWWTLSWPQSIRAGAMHSFAFLGLDSLEYFSNLLTFNMFVLSFKGQILSHLWVKRTSKTFMKWFIRILFWNLNMIFCTYLNNSRVFSFTDMFLFFF